MGIPNGPDELTPAWFADTLGWQVDDVDVVEIGAGIGVSSAVYRATLTGGGPSVPPSVVVKMVALDPAAAFTSSVLRFYTREVQFYDQLAADAPVRTPAGFHGAVSDDGSNFVLVIEDMGGNRMIDQTVETSLDDAGRIVDAVAGWHARWWGNVDGLCDCGTAVALTDPIYPAMLPGLFDEGWLKLNASSHCVPCDELRPVGERWSGSVPALLDALGAGPLTLLHGDVRTDNIMFAHDDVPIFLDFQILGVGSPAYDIAYFITQSLDVDAVTERELFDRWIAGLRSNGVASDELAPLWEQYRIAAAFCLAYPVIAARGMDLDDPRERALVQAMMNRFARAAVDLDLVSTLP